MESRGGLEPALVFLAFFCVGRLPVFDRVLGTRAPFALSLGFEGAGLSEVDWVDVDESVIVFFFFFGFAIEKHRMSDCTRTSEMSSATNAHRDQEQSGNEGTVDLVPPYHNEIESFDNAEAYTDMELVVGNGERYSSVTIYFDGRNIIKTIQIE